MIAFNTPVASRAAQSAGPQTCQGGLRLFLAAALLPAMLAACTGSLEPSSYATPPSLEEELPKYVPSSEPYRAGAEHFARGEYGLSERDFREATEKAPKDAASWIGLAASYDRLARFDLADRAYQTAIALSGETAQILNNQGYSYMLRGNLVSARAKFAKAQSLEPNNPLVRNNLILLDNGAKYINPGGR